MSNYARGNVAGSSTSHPGGNQVDGLPPAPSFSDVKNVLCKVFHEDIHLEEIKMGKLGLLGLNTFSKIAFFQ